MNLQEIVTDGHLEITALMSKFMYILCIFLLLFAFCSKVSLDLPLFSRVIGVQITC